jgi:hypothetical protein
MSYVVEGLIEVLSPHLRGATKKTTKPASHLRCEPGPVIDQGVSRRLPKAEARVRVQVR